MSNKESTPSAVPAPSEMREQAKQLATAAAFEIKGDCPHCEGSGYSSETARRIVHTFAGAFGADWELDRVHAAIDAAASVRWTNDLAGHDLAVMVDGREIRFQVKRPAQTEGAA